MNVRRVVGGVGRALILAGTLVLLFVAYQLWGTAWAEARAQDRLRDEFATVLAETTTTAAPTPTTTTTTVVQAPPPPEGAAVAILSIPDIGLEKAVVEGVGVGDLKKGPGHYPSTPMPGQPGNAAIAGHRTTYGAPFHRLDELEQGDDIVVTTHQGTFRYEVAASQIVAPGDVDVLDDFGDNRLTLTTCHPKYSARQRLIVSARLVDDAAPDNIDESRAPETPGGLPGEDVGGERPAETIDGFGLSGEGAANGPAVFWGVLAALVLLGEWWLGRVWLRWPAYALVTPVFLVVLFIFFENFSRLLPANI